jgi:hypothetical protein
MLYQVTPTACSLPARMGTALGEYVVICMLWETVLEFSGTTKTRAFVESIGSLPLAAMVNCTKTDCGELDAPGEAISTRPK